MASGDSTSVDGQDGISGDLEDANSLDKEPSAAEEVTDDVPDLTFDSKIFLRVTFMYL